MSDWSGASENAGAASWNSYLFDFQMHKPLQSGQAAVWPSPCIETSSELNKTRLSLCNAYSLGKHASSDSL
jgi:hypothetical protein